MIIQPPNITGFDDFILLSSANKLIEDVSTYSYWAGIFSNATEKHVDFGFHGMLRVGEGRTTRPAIHNGFIYHDARNNDYFGELLLNGSINYRYHLSADKNETIPRNIRHPHGHHGHHHPSHQISSHVNHTRISSNMTSLHGHGNRTRVHHSNITHHGAEREQGIHKAMASSSPQQIRRYQLRFR